MQPHDFWQTLLPPHSIDPAAPSTTSFAATLGDGRQLLLPIRPLDDKKTALASLIINQASFSVCDALCNDLAERLAPLQPDIICGLPTLGLTLAAGVTRALGMPRYVPLGNSRKFWYEDTLSVPVSSITTPGAGKRLFMDPRMLPLLQDKRVVLVDDVISSGRSIIAGLRLMEALDIRPVAIAAAMLQSRRSFPAIADLDPALPQKIHYCFETPLLERRADGVWHPQTKT